MARSVVLNLTEWSRQGLRPTLTGEQALILASELWHAALAREPDPASSLAVKLQMAGSSGRWQVRVRVDEHELRALRRLRPELLGT